MILVRIQSMLNVISSGCFEGELVKVLQSENPPELSMQTSNDSPTPICPFENLYNFSGKKWLCRKDAFGFRQSFLEA
jgi:hypothetical protein